MVLRRNISVLIVLPAVMLLVLALSSTSVFAANDKAKVGMSQAQAQPLGRKLMTPLSSPPRRGKRTAQRQRLLRTPPRKGTAPQTHVDTFAHPANTFPPDHDEHL